MTKSNKTTVILISLIAVLLFFVAFTYPSDKFKIIACDVGQGDAILAYYKTTQLLVDAGPNDSVLKCLNKYIPFWDRKIELMVITHPQVDHFGGALDVLSHYKIDNILINSLDSGSQVFSVLKSEVGGRGVNIINPQNVSEIGLGMIHLDILFPTKDFIAQNSSFKNSNIEQNVLGACDSNLDPNDYSIMAILSFGEFDALMTGDSGPEVVDDIIATGRLRDVEYIKVPHHGSKNGLTQGLLEKIKPEVAVISVGKNSYGHPHKETLDMLESRGIKVFRTDQDENVEVDSDRKNWWVK